MNIFKNEWVTLQKQYFLRTVYDRSLNNPLNQSQIDILYKNLTLYSGYNAEVNFGYFMVVLLHGKVIEEDVKNALITFLGKFGRLKYLRPLYRALYTRDKETALSTFEKWKSSYHPIAVRLIELDFKSLE